MRKRLTFGDFLPFVSATCLLLKESVGFPPRVYINYPVTKADNDMLVTTKMSGMEQCLLGAAWYCLFSELHSNHFSLGGSFLPAAAGREKELAVLVCLKTIE